MEFSKKEHWSGLPFLTPGDLPDPGIKPMSPALVGVFFTIAPPGKPIVKFYMYLIDVCVTLVFSISETIDLG